MKDVRERLFELADDEYRRFQSNLCPGVEGIIGVRIPKLRELAKEIIRDDFRAYINDHREDYYEEKLLLGFVIASAKCDYEERIKYIEDFVPKIDNWAICDSFCCSLKFTKKNMSSVYTFLKNYLESDKEFELRFGIVMLLDYYIVEDYIDEVLSILDSIKHEAYYVKMAVAWAISICYIKFPQKTIALLKDNTLDDFTYNKALQKICESLRIDKETKLMIKSMKRK